MNISTTTPIKDADGEARVEVVITIGKDWTPVECRVHPDWIDLSWDNGKRLGFIRIDGVESRIADVVAGELGMPDTKRAEFCTALEKACATIQSAGGRRAGYAASPSDTRADKRRPRGWCADAVINGLPAVWRKIKSGKFSLMLFHQGNTPK